MKLLGLITLLFVTDYVVCFDYDGWLNIKLQHKLNCNNENENYCTRAAIHIESIRLGSPNIDQITFTQQHFKELEELAETDGFYSIKSIVTTGDKEEAEFLSSVKAQAFLESGLMDIINVWMLPNGEVIAVNIQVANSSEPKTTSHGYIHSNVYIHHIDQAPVPDTASYIQKLEREREAREKGEIKDNRSFLAKYWMYIVPIAVFVMISGAATPEQPAQGAR
ncbi:ER membrane protein complex subunit 10 [Epargyreus clarus]|uniref:ER membrane protein complex subunit 10 n=1 Tax=Epargyreus clarus TaxID=520877 RepID=UPI003C2B6E93